MVSLLVRRCFAPFRNELGQQSDEGTKGPFCSLSVSSANIELRSSPGEQEPWSRYVDKYMAWPSFLFALVSGAFITCQAGANTQLKKALGQPMPAAVVNYLLGLSAVLAYSLITRVSVPTLGTASKAPWWSWTGGLLGVAYGLAAIFLGDKLGAATLTALVVTGQLICSV